ncbi:MAG: CPBP family intramembrane metalloprotease [Chloroflexota bacterium]|nr:CPBP family intramembrane metalloprotease [Chloroflexota bacterium]
MFNWMLILILVAVSVPGILVAAPGLIESQMKTMLAKLPADKELPSKATLTMLTVVQSLVIVTVLAAVGSVLAPRVGLAAPFFEGLVSGQGAVDALMAQLGPALIVGVGGALLFIAAYYLFFRPRLDEQTVQAMEGVRMQLGPWSRVLYGGIVEEVISRWGVMTLFVWLGSLLVGEAPDMVVWSAIVLSGVLFGLGHLPAYLGAGCRKTPLFLAATIKLNLWASLIFGWLFWQVGLLAAMLAHMLFHLLWLPFDLRFARHPEPLPAS